MFDKVLKLTGILTLCFAGYANAQIPQPAAPDSAQTQPASGESSEQTDSAVAQLIAFLDGLDEAVGSDMSDCAEVTNALKHYYEEHREWIDNLNYVTENADAQVAEQIRQKATAFGKKLSACYAEPAIPILLKKYAKSP